MDKFNYRDFFDFDGANPLKDIVNDIDNLKNAYLGMIDAVTKGLRSLEGEQNRLKSQASEMLSSVNSLNVTYEANQKALMAQADASKKLVMQNERLEKSQEESVKTLNQLNKGLEMVKKSRDTLSKSTTDEANSLDDLKKQLNEATKAYKALGDSVDSSIKEEQLNRVKELSRAFNEQNKALLDARKSADIAAGSYNELNKQVLEGRKRLKAWEDGLSGTSEEFKQLQKEVREGRDRLAEWDKAIGDNFRNVGNYESALDGLGDKFKNLGVSIKKPTDALKGFATDIPIPALAGFAVAIVGVVEGMEALFEITDEVKGNLRDVAALTGLAGEELENLTAGIRATAATFDADFNEVLRATNVLTETFGLTGEEALAKINAGFLQGADASGELLDQISEYSAQFRAAGLDADALISIIDTSTDQGIFSDKGADTIKEAGLSLRELTKATSDALKPLGDLRNEQIRAAIEGGETFEAIQLVSTALKEVDLTAQQTQTIIADVFKGAGEDAGLPFILSLSEINTKLDETTDGLNEYQKAQAELLVLEQDLAESQVALADALGSTSQGFKGFGIALQTFAIDLVLALIKAFQPLKVAFQAVFDAFSELVGIFTQFNSEGEESIGLVEILAAVFQTLLTPITLVARGIAFFAEKVSDVIKGSTLLQGIIFQLTLRFKEFVGFIEDAPALLSGFLNAVVAVFTGIDNVARQTLVNVKDLIVAVFDPTTSVSDVLSRSKKTFTDFGTSVADAFKEGYLSVKKEEKAEEASIEAEAQENLKKQAVQTSKEKVKVISDIEKKAAEKRLKELEALEKKASKARLKLFKMEQKELIRLNQEIINDQNSTVDERLIAAQNIANIQEGILEAEKNAALSNSELIAEERLVIEQKYANDVAALQRKLSKQLGQIITDGFQQEFNTQQIEVDTAALEELDELNQKFLDGEIKSLQKFEDEKERIQTEANEKLLMNQLNFLEQSAQQLRDAGQDTTEIDNKIAEARLAISNKEAQDRIEKEKMVQAALRDLRDVALSGALTVLDNLNEAEDLKREQDLEKLNQQKEAELEAAGDNEERRIAIEKKFAEEEDKINKQQAEANKRRAIFEKALAATEIGIQTGIAITKAVAASPLTGGLPFSAIVGAIGAVQLAAVLSKPIPQFEKGTSYSDEGLAIINEAGIEIQEYAGKKSVIHSEGAVLTSLKRGTKIYDAKTSEKMLQQAEYEALANEYSDGAEAITVIQPDTQSNEMVLEALKEVNRSIKNQKQPIINLDKNDLTWGHGRGQRFVEYINHKYQN